MFKYGYAWLLAEIVVRYMPIPFLSTPRVILLQIHEELFSKQSYTQDSFYIPNESRSYYGIGRPSNYLPTNSLKRDSPSIAWKTLWRNTLGSIDCKEI